MLKDHIFFKEISDGKTAAAFEGSLIMEDGEFIIRKNNMLLRGIVGQSASNINADGEEYRRFPAAEVRDMRVEKKLFRRIMVLGMEDGRQYRFSFWHPDESIPYAEEMLSARAEKEGEHEPGAAGMIRREFRGKELSLFGFGSMRLPVIGGNDARIDEAKVRELVAAAMENGVNYYDTAWGYHNGNSEIVLGRALSAYPRESWYLATKFPGYDLSNMPKVQEIFEQQLTKCGVDYFDFYLFHNVCELNIDAYLDPQYGIFEYLMEQKDYGRIRHLGFSSHGSPETMRRFLEAYGSGMEFCQLQLNYLDWTFQQGREKAELLAEYGIPVWVMEPLRGGRLAALSEEEKSGLLALQPEMSPVEWAFRFVQNIPGVRVILSGVSDLDQLEEDLQFFREERELTEEEQAALRGTVEIMTAQKTVPCTACRYCTGYCPQELDIPGLLALYNENSFTDGGFIAPMALQAMEDGKKPSACVGCGACAAVCPQQIDIPAVMADLAALQK